MSTKQPIVLIIGATGQTGRLIAEDFGRDPGNVRLRLAARKQADVERLKSAGNEAVYLNLDDPTTFGPALAGVDRLYLLTGYTVAMLHQSKTLVDAAKKARVRHIVHQGIFGEWDCTDPHFAWHQMIETYIKASGIAWTHPDRAMVCRGRGRVHAAGDGRSDGLHRDHSRRRAIRDRATLDRLAPVGDGKTGLTAKGGFRRLGGRWGAVAIE